eukprot:ctg_730.g296
MERTLRLLTDAGPMAPASRPLHHRDAITASAIVSTKSSHSPVPPRLPHECLGHRRGGGAGGGLGGERRHRRLPPLSRRRARRALHRGTRCGTEHFPTHLHHPATGRRPGHGGGRRAGGPPPAAIRLLGWHAERPAAIAGRFAGRVSATVVAGQVARRAGRPGAGAAVAVGRAGGGMARRAAAAVPQTDRPVRERGVCGRPETAGYGGGVQAGVRAAAAGRYAGHPGGRPDPYRTVAPGTRTTTARTDGGCAPAVHSTGRAGLVPPRPAAAAAHRTAGAGRTAPAHPLPTGVAAV